MRIQAALASVFFAAGLCHAHPDLPGYPSEKPPVAIPIQGTPVGADPLTDQPNAQHSEPAAPEIPDDGTRVAVLGYHEFSEKQKETQMRIKTSKFRAQMEAIRQAGITVISMADFIAWKRGEKSLPPKCILIGIDDGWISTYTDAYPILREYKYPFTLYLYKNYLDGGGKSMTSAMIREMMQNGASIGSHSVSHPFPSDYRKKKRKSAKELDAFLRNEIGESKRFLEEKFSTRVTTYAYPGGFVLDEMLALADEFGYSHLFTVLPGKIKRGMPDKTLPRYMILGNFDPVFTQALDFTTAPPPDAGGNAGGPAAPPVPVKLPYPVSPEPGATINDRMPEISVDFVQAADIDPASLTMRISGFGVVPANYAAETGKYSWKLNRRLRQPSCTVTVAWKDKAGTQTTTPMRWTFQIDRTAAYLPESK